MAILSLQSAVAAGHVGNSGGVFALQRLGVEVWRIDTVRFSNHPAYGDHSGQVTATEEVGDLIAGLDARGLWTRCRGILSGYLGQAATGTLIVETVRRIRAQSPDALFLCDPVIGDHGRVYVDDNVVDFYRTAGVTEADILTPNAFEAEHLTGVPTDTVGGAVAAAEALRRDEYQTVVVTGVPSEGGVSTIALRAETALRVETPTIDRPTYGAGDLFAALLLGLLTTGRPFAEAFSHAVSSVHAVLDAGPSRPELDIPLIAGQDRLITPPILFSAESIN